MENKTHQKKYYFIDDNNNGFWNNEITDREREVMIYNPKTDVWHTKRNYEDYFFGNCTTNPRNKTNN
jgi:hypothetical protein